MVGGARLEARPSWTTASDHHRPQGAGLMTVSIRNRRLNVAWLLAALIALPALGCSGGSGSKFALNPRRVAIREQLSRLEFQNQQLKDELKVAQQESKRLNNDLQLAEIDNRDLERRLDSFRTQLGLRGSSDESIDVARPFPDDNRADSGTTRPAAQPPTRAPFTRIPNPAAIDVSPPPGPSAEEFYGIRRSPSYDQQTRPQIEPPPVQYFDLSPSVSVGRTNLDVRSRDNPSNWSPISVGGSSRVRRY
ncbi:hypothetical protein AB1L88_23015 [Tautonia sp. JC769]|uniref:hypothetical protein n=1 Tax=Tautonia sp. JC769 TaxID=3232135 RepID=UPI003458C59E